MKTYRKPNFRQIHFPGQYLSIKKFITGIGKEAAGVYFIYSEQRYRTGFKNYLRIYCVGAYPCPGPSTPSLHPVGALQLQPLHLQHSVRPHVGQVRVSQEGHILYSIHVYP
jgi:hypothetical protein